MLTYSFQHIGKKPLYEYLYECIRKDILDGVLAPGEKLPSKRSFSKHLGISTMTVEGAYGQLIAEGYVKSFPKRGYYVSQGIQKPKAVPAKNAGTAFASSDQKHQATLDASAGSSWFMDFASNSINTENFPFSTWTKLLRSVVAKESDRLVCPVPSFGALPLRKAIAEHLLRFRELSVDASQIVIGAGTEYLYGLLVQFFRNHKRFAVENPGYDRIRKTYQSCGAEVFPIGFDSYGVDLQELQSCHAEILHISPSHHFPTGWITPISRRYELLGWASAAERYIIEDDYDSEFRLTGRPIPTLMGIDASDCVIYMNTFSKSLTPTIRISYLVLPRKLVIPFKNRLGFYHCPVSNFEQYTLARFMQKGYFEKHINRMRTLYRQRRRRLLNCLKQSRYYDEMNIVEQGSGLHFLLDFRTSQTDHMIRKKLATAGIRMNALRDFYFPGTENHKLPAFLEENSLHHEHHFFILNYSGIQEERLEEAVQRLECIWQG
jgi:GntR family transcriptional regulator/MocR family aminotransferase